MYKIYADQRLLYDPRLPDYGLLDVKCVLETNKTGTLTFKIPSTHPMLNEIRKMYTEISIYQDGEWLFSGRVLNDTEDFYGNRDVTCEGELSYLLDSIQRPNEYHDISVEDYVRAIIENHNADVDSRKQFEVGIVNVPDSNDSLYRYANYENTWEYINDRLINRLGGYIRTRRVDGQRILDYVTDYDNINSQVIQFGENLLDMIREVRGEDLCTVVVPLGAKDEETEERLTIASVNDGKDYIEDAEVIALYGRIVKVIEYDDVTLPENLMRKGQSVLNSQRLLSVCITLTAVDLHLLNVDIEKIKLGDLIRVISKPHGLDEYLMIQKLELDISHPENSKVTLGITKQTLAESVGKKERQAITEILNVQSSQSERLSSVRTEIRECYSEISKTSEEIRSEVREEYLSKDDLETIRQDFETSITQSSTEIRMDFTTVTNDILSQVNGNQRLLEEYIRFKGALIELGKVGNAFTCELDNTRLAFKQNGVVIAYFSNNSLMITDAEVRNRLSFGTADNGYFDFIPRANGNLSVRYRNGAS